MAIEKLINHSQGEDIKTALNTIATNIQTVGAVSLETLGMGFTTCSTEQAAAAKTATLTGYTIADGGIVSVKFSNAVDAGATLNINSQGAKPIYYKGAAITNSIINAGAIATFVYSNNQYQLINLDTDVEQVQTNKTNILSIQNQMQIENEFDGTTYGTGYYSNAGNLVQNASFKHTFISCAPNDIIRFNLQSEALTGQYGGLWLDNTFVRAINGLQTNQGDYYEFTVPSGVNKVCINFTIPSTLVISKNVPWLNNAAHTDIYMRNLDITNNLKNANVSFKNDVSYATIFRKVCCIGDSLTAGEYGSDGTTLYGIYSDYSYPAFLAKQIDANVQNLGIGGQSTKTWYENYSQTFTPEQKDWTGYDAFIIFLGTNGGVDGNIDSSDDSMMGYYCKIIEMIITANAQASIFLCTSPWTSSRDLKPNFTTQILALGEHYSLPVLRLDQSKILTYEQRFINQPYDNLIHYGRTGYMRLASEIVRCINDVTPTYFNKLYGTHT